LLAQEAQPRPQAAAPQAAPAPASPAQTLGFPPSSEAELVPSQQELSTALIRVPLAAALGALLALRPRRRGTPPRTPAVVETQIVLSAVGALIMLIVGASLARAFGIVGAANLIRYRSKIDDPKDAVVMLCALAVGLAAGVGLYLLAVVSTLLLVLLLWVIESFEPRVYKHFDLKVAAKGEAEGLRMRLEQLLRRFKLPFDGRALSADELTYDVQVPLEMHTDPVSRAIVALAPAVEIGVSWDEKKPKNK
jgi:uncharacterized membrane protein YhiD involved in acid resistance